MEIKSKFLGDQQVDPDSIITFPVGIPGFEDQKQFKLFHQEDNPSIFWLQSIDDEDLTFSLTSPNVFNINYSFLLTDEELAQLQLDDEDDLIILILLHTDSASPGVLKPTVKGSIKSPILINASRRIGIQKYMPDLEQSIILKEPHNEIDLQQVN